MRFSSFLCLFLLLSIGCAKGKNLNNPVGLVSHDIDAGQETHGGGGFVCEDEDHKILSVELFDYAEARVIIDGSPGLKLDLGEPSLAVSDKVQLVLGRLRDIDQVAYERYSKRANVFLSEARFVDGKQIDAVNDQGEQIDIPPKTGCHKTQLAIQFSNPTEIGARYWLDSKLWDASSNDTRAGLILHEIIYTDLIAHKSQTSSKARFFNIQISILSLSSVWGSPPSWDKSIMLRNPESYLELLSQSGLIFSDSKEHSIKVGGVDFWPDNLTFQPTLLKASEGKMVADLVTAIQGQQVRFVRDQLIKFHYSPAYWSADNPLSISNGTIDGDYKLKTSTGKTVKLSGTNTIALTIDGLVVQ